jgi:L-glutamine-phosphate cytidylyltransferase
MQAMILAAGQGRRLGDRRGRPKCLRAVGGAPLVHHQLAHLAAAGVTDVVIVVGFGRDQIHAAVGNAVRYVVNKRFAETNSMVSFLLGQRLIDDDVLVVNGDVFCHPDMFATLAEFDGDALLYDSGSAGEEEEMKVRIDSGRLVEMSKTLRAEFVAGENVGMLRFSRETVTDIADAATSIAAAEGEQAWLATAINAVAGRRPIACLDVAGRPWVEIDFPGDLVRARTEVLAAAYAGAGSMLSVVS